jgi:hypothetical protein
MISRNRFDLINEIIPKGKRLEYYFDLFYYHGNTDVNYDYVFNKYPNVNKGYSHLPQQVSFQEADYVISDEVIPLPDVDNAYFTSLLEELKDFDGEVLFLELPLFYTQDLAATCGYSEYMERTVRKYGYDYLDLSKVKDDIGLDSQFDYSLDYLHFNTLSAEKITDYLSQYLSENYELTDHREDTAYENWQSQYEYWLEVKAYLQGLNESEILERFKAADLDQYINFMESEYYSGTVDYSEDSVHVTLIKNRTDEVVDDAYFIYNEIDDKWVRNETDEK